MVESVALICDGTISLAVVVNRQAPPTVPSRRDLVSGQTQGHTPHQDLNTRVSCMYETWFHFLASDPIFWVHRKTCLKKQIMHYANHQNVNVTYVLARFTTMGFKRLAAKAKTLKINLKPHFAVFWWLNMLHSKWFHLCDPQEVTSHTKTRGSGTALVTLTRFL